MNPPVATQAEVLFSDINIFPRDGEETLRVSLVRDRRMLRELKAAHDEAPRTHSPETGLYFLNAEIAKRVRAEYGAEEMIENEEFLTERGTFDIPIVTGYSVVVDGVERPVYLVAATATKADGANHGEMSLMLYLRDQIQVASAFMEIALLDPEKYADKGQLGKELLLSALHLMSTSSQLNRFDNVIQKGKKAGQADWPQISLFFDDLAGEKPNGWRNKQDSFQMLAYATLDAVERGLLKVDELDEAHKKFLGSIVPLLESVGFPRYESSGSWEEVAAERTSVMSVETALLHKMKTLMESGSRLDFLAEGYQGDFQQALDTLLNDGLHELGRRLPFESPDYHPDSVEFREADAALAYVLKYDIPRLLADNQIPMSLYRDRPAPVEVIEDAVLTQLRTLIDFKANGIIRYHRDSYQGLNFFTSTVQGLIKRIKEKVKRDARDRGGEIDLVEKQSLRDRLTPGGKPAVWTHPVGQIGAAITSRSMLTEGIQADDYRRLSTLLLNMSLATLTGENQQHAVLNDAGEYEVRPVRAFKAPECLVAFRSPMGEDFRVVSSHNPLNWSTATFLESFVRLRVATQQAELQDERDAA